MEFREGVPVYGPDGKQVGKVDYLVVDPARRRVTHIVIRRRHLLPEDKVAAVEQLSTVTEERIQLNCAPEALLPFEEAHYTTIDQWVERQRAADVVPFLWGKWRTGDTTYLYVRETTERNIPEGEVPVAEGAVVEGPNGERLGHVRELVTDPASGRISQLVVETGHLRGKHNETLPADQVSEFGEDHVTVTARPPHSETVPARHAG